MNIFLQFEILRNIGLRIHPATDKNYNSYTNIIKYREEFNEKLLEIINNLWDD